jgi:prepilin-type N-terminal cleavage/methylation domain-containing protein
MRVMNFRDAKGGFTLTELLVSTAIFAIMMTAIGALFVASLHAVRAGYQSQEAFETSRGTFNILERDLSTVFTSRDFGQYYQFYGNEYGMSMVGLLQLRDDSGREYTRIGRISYVIFPVVVRGADGYFYVTEPFALDYDKKVGTNNEAGRAPEFLRTRGVRYSGPIQNSEQGQREVAIAALVRYVEPGVSDLDSFPFDWNELVDFYEGNPEFPASNSPNSMRSQLNASLEAGGLSTNPSTDLRLLARLDSARDQMFAAKKRDLWLRMLSGQKFWIPRLVNGVAFLPDIWKDGWLNNGAPVNPRDYVAVDNIGIFTPQDYWTTWPLMAYSPQSSLGYKPFFEFGRITADTSVDLMPFWNSNRQSYAGNTVIPVRDGIDNDQDGMVDENANDGFDNDGDGAIDEVDELTERLSIAGTTDPAILDLDANAFERDRRDNNANGLVDELGETFSSPIEMDGLDNDFDGTVDEIGETVDSNRARDLPETFVAYGSPLHPRLPEAVMVRLPMVFDSAHVNAPTFERFMEQLVDVPTAYTRSHLAYEQP